MFSQPIHSSGGSGITAIIQDLTPKLGGDLDGDQKDLNNIDKIEVNNVDMATGLTDTLHSGGDGFVNMKQAVGSVYNDVMHFPLNNLYFFPQGQDLLYYNKLPVLNNIIVAKCRDAGGQPIAVGANRGSAFGSTQTFQDKIIYDPLGTRSEKVGIAWTRVRVRPWLINCMWKFEVHADIDWAAPDPNNRFRCLVDHYRGGVLLRTYTILDRTTNGVTDVCSSNKLINGGGLGEDVILDDEFHYKIECHATSPQPIGLCRMVHWTTYATPRI